jgi:hypothetical protein
MGRRDIGDVGEGGGGDTDADAKDDGGTVAIGSEWMMRDVVLS